MSVSILNYFYSCFFLVFKLYKVCHKYVKVCHNILWVKIKCGVNSEVDKNPRLCRVMFSFLIYCMEARKNFSLKNHLNKQNIEVNCLNLFSRETILVKCVQYSVLFRQYLLNNWLLGKFFWLSLLKFLP